MSKTANKSKRLRLEIAKLCGWSIPLISVGPNAGKPSPDFIKGPNGELALLRYLDGNGKNSAAVPDYFNDLNAIHEATDLMVFGPVLYRRWCRELRAIVKTALVADESFGGLDLSADDPEGLKDGSWLLEYHIYRATASQRAEALLKTFDKWPERLDKPGSSATL